MTLTVKAADGKVTANAKPIRLNVGQTMTIKATSDVADELHTHPIDMSVDVKPGETARLTFTVDKKGIFYVEFHHQEKIAAIVTVT